MANLNFNVKQAFLDVFGITGVFHFPDANHAATKDTPIKLSNVPVLDISDTSASSLLGTPIFMPFSIQAKEYQTLEYGQLVKRSVPNYTFPSTTLVDFDRAKKIVKTEIAGRNGSVKELITLNDYNVSIKGFIMSKPTENSFPEKEVEQLRKIFEAPVSLRLVGKIFDLMGITDVVFEGINFPSVEGSQNMQPFSISGVSDEPFELRFRNDKKSKIG